ncbi:lysozyme [Phenylobacterium montanum]|uniref:lysozyme n=1 Tax=Phenylobacterium montanum TaxID=2823693 RepID=UPI0020127CA1|nr:lysozyme [Caulobacter sp. S6]
MTIAQSQVSQAGLALLMEFEGYRRRAARLADGRWTIGYGHTLSAREGAEVSEEDAKALLVYDLRGVAAVLEDLVFTPLNQNQFDALACFAFNIGVENFRHSAVLKLVNEGYLLQAAYALEHWRRAEIDGEVLVVDGLVRRRAAEKALFLTPIGGWTPAPSAVVPPQLDHEPGHHGLNSHTVDLHADLTGEIARVERLGAPPPLDPTPILASIFSPEADAVEPFPGTPQTEPRPLAETVAAALAELPPIAPAPALPPPTQQAPPQLEAELLADSRRPPVRAQFAEFDYAVAEIERGSHWSWIGLGLLGVAVFAVSLFWALSARGQAGPFSPQVIGTLMALAGVACVVCAVYSLVQAYLGRDD